MELSTGGWISGGGRDRHEPVVIALPKHPACEPCSKKLPEGSTAERRPPRRGREWELCCFCTDATNSGIYVSFVPLTTVMCGGQHATRGADPEWGVNQR
jgi:hypothetical protein